jgi:hypothetical protein
MLLFEPVAATTCRGAMGIAGGLWRVETTGRNLREVLDVVE